MPSLMLFGDGLAAVLAFALLLACHWQLTAAQLVQQGQVEVSTASQLSGALRDPNVWDILVTADMDMASELASWAALPADIPVTHNLTIHGPPGQHPAIDFRYWQFNGSTPHGLALGPDATLTFKYLTIRDALYIPPGIIVNVTNTSRIVVDNCISHRYVLGEHEVVLSLLLGTIRMPWEPPDYKQGLVLPSGYCRTAPDPMCWDNAVILVTHTTQFSGINAAESGARVDVYNAVTAWEAVITPQCAVLYFQDRNITCVVQEINQVLARAPPGSFWVQPTPFPERVATIMAAYESTMSAYYQSRAGVSPAASTLEPSPTSSSSTAFFPLPGVYVVVGAVVGVMGIAAAVCWLLARRRATGRKEDKLHQVLASIAHVDGQDQADGDHKVLDANATTHTPPGHADAEPMRTSSTLDLEAAASSDSDAEQDTKMLLEQGLRPEAITVQEANSVDVVVPESAQQHPPFSLLEMVTLNTPFTPSLATDLKLGVDVILGSEIGHGAVGTVHRATFKGQPVAVKLFKPGTDVKTFVSELAILGRTRHPNVIRVVGACVGGDELALVEELADGSLEELLFPSQPPGSQGTLLPLPLVLHIAMEVASALAYLHPTIIHRDLKPGNVLLKIDPSIYQSNDQVPLQLSGTLEGIHAKLSDFGLSRIFNSLVLVTQTPLRGTLGYIAPECFKSTKTLTHKCDIYSFAILLWEMVHGTRAWQGLTQHQMMYAMTVARLRPAITADDTRCPTALRRLIERCWQTDVDLRPPALEVVRTLAVILQQHLQSDASTPGIQLQVAS